MELRKQSETILVVDDHCAIHKLVKACLELEGYTVLTADGAESAMKLYRQHRSAVALLLTDVSMPNVSGLELADRVLQLEPELKILFMSASDGASPGFGCIRKPFTQAELIGKVGEVCRR
jgi:two-component system, cell cycle sensor histidine kinase and response regulator CckA